MSTNPLKFLVRADEEGFERLVMAEVMVPDIPNVYGDVYTREAIRDFCHEYARQGYGVDVNHDQLDVRDVDVYVCETFIVRPGDPDFIEGSWVVGMKIISDDLWAKVLSGEINGYSIEALCEMQPVVFQNLRNRQIVGVTEPDPYDGHTHTFTAVLDSINRPIAGGTGVTNGHSHRIVSHTVTEFATGLTGKSHSHRYQVITADNGEGETDDID